MTLFRSLLFLLVLTALHSNAAAVMPDCVGLRPGMSAEQAHGAFKSHNSALKIQTVELQIPALAEKPVPETLFVVRMPENGGVGAEPLETLQATISLPPNKATVWKVIRFLRFEEGREQTKAS